MEQTRGEFYDQFPTADYDAPEDADPEKRAKRKSINKRYDNQGMVSSELPLSDDEGRLKIVHFEPIPGLPEGKSWIIRSGLPAAESEIVIVGEILDAQAFVSNNKQGVYSEYSVRIKEILKNNSTNLTSGSLITIDRENGYVRYKNGKKRLYRIGGRSMTLIRQRYVLFLNKPDESPNYNILTGYKLNANFVEALDDFPPFTPYIGLDESTFMKAVRGAVTQSLQSAPKER